jgi:uracil-DNA glycosylase
LARRVRACQRCRDLVRCRNRPVPGILPAGGSPRYLLVGLAPGRLGADRTGLPFCGDQSGARLQALILATGLAPHVVVTNAVKCAPKDCQPKRDRRRLPRRAFSEGQCGVLGAPCRAINRDPTAEEVRNCRPYLAEEVQLVHPLGVVALGRVAEQAVLDALERSERPGVPGERRGSAPWVSYLPHPAAWGYQPAWRDLCQKFLRELAVTQDRDPSFYQ